MRKKIELGRQTLWFAFPILSVWSSDSLHCFGSRTFRSEEQTCFVSHNRG